jgi:iron complex transport system ATP-binding protein
MLLQTQNITIGYKASNDSSRLFVAMNFSVENNEIVGILGLNGAGKSTLLKTLAGSIPALGGIILLDNHKLDEIKLKDRAKKMSVVLTENMIPGNLELEHLISLGRFPHTNWMGKISEEDRGKIEETIELLGLDNLRKRKLGEVSDGEKQKALIGRSLAQDTKLLLMDEPTAHLDLVNKVEIFRIVKKLKKESQKTIVLATHELEMALQVCDKLVLLGREGFFKIGKTNELVESGDFEKIFAGKNVDFNKSNRRFSLEFE